MYEFLSNPHTQLLKTEVCLVLMPYCLQVSPHPKMCRGIADSQEEGPWYWSQSTDAELWILPGGAAAKGGSTEFFLMG